MKRKLRHPIRSITEPYGKAGLMVAILALVLATTGAAFAAAGLNSKQKKEVTAIAKKFAGKNGANGANGANGEKGPKGDPGAAGAPGESVMLGAATGCGTPGGTKLSVGTEEAEVCNGTAGKNGTTGFTKTLPSKETESGDWTMRGEHQEFEAVGGKKITTGGAGFFTAAISFNIPLAAPLDALHANYIGATVKAGEGTGELTSGSNVVKNVSTSSGQFTVGSYVYDQTTAANIPAGTYSATRITKVISGSEFEMSEPAAASGGDSLKAGLPTGCSGSAEAPVAAQGYLCVFASEEQNFEPYYGGLVSFINPEGTPSPYGTAGKSGTTIIEQVVGNSTNFAWAYGTWAVTAP